MDQPSDILIDILLSRSSADQFALSRSEATWLASQMRYELLPDGTCWRWADKSELSKSILCVLAGEVSHTMAGLQGDRAAWSRHLPVGRFIGLAHSFCSREVNSELVAIGDVLVSCLPFEKLNLMLVRNPVATAKLLHLFASALANLNIEVQERVAVMNRLAKAAQDEATQANERADAALS